MFKPSEEQKRKAKIHRLLSNGYKFSVMSGDLISTSFRYKYEAERHKKHGVEVVELQKLL